MSLLSSHDCGHVTIIHLLKFGGKINEATLGDKQIWNSSPILKDTSKIKHTCTTIISACTLIALVKHKNICFNLHKPFLSYSYNIYCSIYWSECSLFIWDATTLFILFSITNTPLLSYLNYDMQKVLTPVLSTVVFRSCLCHSIAKELLLHIAGCLVSIH